MNLEGKRVTVVGLGISGAAMVRFLAARGALVGVSDSEPEVKFSHWLRLHREQLERTEFGGHTEAFLLSSDLIVVSPGVPLNLPVLEAARQAGLPLVGDFEIALDGCAARLAAVTGTNGKTTTTALLGHLLKTAGLPMSLAGNIGVPVAQVAEEVGADHTIVAEVSSFQLDLAPSLHPDVGVLLNITPDHLNRYPSFAAYIRSKARLFANQGPDDLAVLNRRDEHCAALAPTLKARVRWFDAHSGTVEGAGVEDGWIVLVEGGARTRVLPAAELSLRGPHNLENALAATVAAAHLGARPAALAEGLRTFAPVEHRLEPAGTIGQVLFINDSKATNVDAQEKALKSFPEPVVLIAGGRDKGLDFTVLRPLLPGAVKAAILIGEAADTIAAAWAGAVTIHRATTLDEAVERGYELAAPKGVVLLSPGCASFDMFENFEDRGRKFRAAVERLARSQRAC